MPDIPITEAQMWLLEFVEHDAGQFGEMHGATLDSLIEAKLVEVQGEDSSLDYNFIAKGTDIMYRAVLITEAGRAALQQKRSKDPE